MSKQQTALMHSIERKKIKVVLIRAKRNMKKSGSIEYKLLVEQIVTLLDEIREDENLLQVEKEQWLQGRESYSAVEDGKIVEVTPEMQWNETYGSDEG